MKQWESEGLVLRIRPFGESDKLVSLFTLEEGKVPALARGARKTGSRLSGVVDSFIRGEYLLYRGRSLATIQQASLLESYSAIRGDVALYYTALYMCELLDKTLEEHHPARGIYRLTLDVFQALNQKGGNNGELLTRSFELLLLKELGYCPSLSGCVVCRRQDPPFFLSAAAGGLLCPECRKGEEGKVLSPGTLALMNRILDRGMGGMKVLRVPRGQLKELAPACWEFLLYNTGITRVKSRVYLENLLQG